MTTIVYDHKTRTIAYDSRVTQGSMITNDNYEKSHEVGELRFFMAGDLGHLHRGIEVFTESFVNDNYPNIVGFVWDKESRQLWEIGSDAQDKDYYKCLLDKDCSYAIGSGSRIALGAMDAGKTAKEAMKIVMGRDTHTGGKIRVFKIK